MSDEDNPHKDKRFEIDYQPKYKGVPLPPYQAPRHFRRKKRPDAIVWSVDADIEARYATKEDVKKIVLLDNRREVKLIKLGVFLAKIQDSTGYSWEVPKVRVFKKKV